MLRGLYAISDEVLTDKNSIIEKAEKAMRGGAKIFQLRDKTSSDEELITLANELKALSDQHSVLFVINDRVELAKKINAPAVHIGKDDGDIAKTKEFLGSGTIVGVSCYRSLDQAILAEKNGADYVAFGSFFLSNIKPDAVKADQKVLIEAKNQLRVPICAIGGITSQNADELIRKGADMVAVISDLWQSENIEKKASKFAELFGGIDA